MHLKYSGWCGLFFSLIVFVSCRDNKSTFHFPAESDKQEAVIITYSGDPDDTVVTKKVHEVTQQLIKAVSPELKIYLLINESTKPDSLINLFHSLAIDTKNIQLVQVYKLFSTGVARDYGPVVVKNVNGERKMLRFEWDYVGADFIHPNPEHVKSKNEIRDRYFNQMKGLLKMDVINSSLAIEGGEIESNGAGVAMLVDSFTLNRNPSLDKKAIESKLYETLGIQKVIWLPEGVAEDTKPGNSRIYGDIYGSGVGGHIDEFARFADEKTILLAMPDSSDNDPIQKINYQRMQRNYELLKAATDLHGNPFKIIFVPTPKVLPDIVTIDTTVYSYPVWQIIDEYPELKKQKTLKFLPAVSYLNYVILNDVVILPEYYREGFAESCRDDDNRVKKLFAELFPGKKIVTVNPWGMNYVGGGVHCWTQPIPIK